MSTPSVSSMFVPEAPVPRNDVDAIRECLTVLERCMRDGLLVGVGSAVMLPDGKVERPLFGCAELAIAHAKQRLLVHDIVANRLDDGVDVVGEDFSPPPAPVVPVTPAARTVRDSLDDYARTPDAAKDLIHRLTSKLIDLRCPDCNAHVGVSIET